MVKFGCTAFVFFLVLVACLLSSVSKASPTYAYHVCPNTTTYAPNSTFRANLNALFSVLSSNATVNRGFYNATAGRSTSDAVYGLFLCRGDLSPTVCQDCVSTATKEVVQSYCPEEKRVVMWYEECMLRYSDLPIFSFADLTYRPTLYNIQNVTDPGRLSLALSEVLGDVETRAASGADSPYGMKFALGQLNYSVLQTLYAMAQCTPDLTVSGCTKCLQDAISSLPICCSGSRGVRVLLPSCNLRYEMYIFYNSTAFPPPPPPPPPPRIVLERKGNPTATLIAIIIPIGVVGLLLFIWVLYYQRKRVKKSVLVEEEDTIDTEITRMESLQFELSIIQTATNNFSIETKLGEGGFGCVYKGKLPNGEDVAVKRLSASSQQGAEEFKNEVVLMAKLQHRNLVRLLGFCLQGPEKILVYEFVPNRSLDYFLFDVEQRSELDWSSRYKIVVGIARGLLYLHEDSQLRIIHRDLKASNILLDSKMNAKISDFGLARIFDADQTREKTRRVVGTYGHMSPEYALHGYFSVKSDVFSFGVLILEIISGKKNSGFSMTGYNDLLNYAWRLWSDGTPLDFVDSSISDNNYSRDEIIRCMHIGLWCVQEEAVERPSMAKVVLMLSSQSVTMSMPQQPATFARGKMSSFEPSTSNSVPSLANDGSITQLDPR